MDQKNKKNSDKKVKGEDQPWCPPHEGRWSVGSARAGAGALEGGKVPS